jgi:hypothetical protein
MLAIASERSSRPSRPLTRGAEGRCLALQVESCSPRLLRLARQSASAGIGLSAGVLAAGPVESVYSSQTTLRRFAKRIAKPP